MVKDNGRNVSSQLEVMVGFAPFSIPLRWENLVWYLAIKAEVARRTPLDVIQRERGSSKDEDEGLSKSHFVVCVGEVVGGRGGFRADRDTY